jgi:FMN phosphatase YigB (HAD superfamily)
MTITLLFDLDDTLLDTNMDAFIPAYFKALSAALADKVEPERMLSALKAGTQAMMANMDPAQTLREVFDSHFFPKLGVDREALQGAIDRFYDEQFPSLATLTKPIPAAAPLLDWAFDRGYRVAIATNPLFPLKAIQHRLSWAGLPTDKYPFDLVTSYENCHFTKESVAYYPEVLALLGWPEDPVVMVGDDMDREVKPTEAAGLPVFLVTRTGEKHKINSLAPIGIPQGSLDSFKSWLENIDPETLRVKFNTPQALLAVLRSSPAALLTLTGSISTNQWMSRPALDEWNLTEIICHLRDLERDVYLPRLQKIQNTNNPFLVAEMTDQWVQERHYSTQDGHHALKEFVVARKKTLAFLDDLGVEWSRTARHSIFGPTNLQEVVNFIAGHDRGHFQQVWKIVNAGRR